MNLFDGIGALAPAFELIRLAVCAYLLGFVAAIPVGATQLEIMRRALKGELIPAILLTVGATSADVIYGCIVFFGVLQVLRVPLVSAIFWLANGAILVGLGIWSLKSSKNEEGPKVKTLKRQNHSLVETPGLALLTGFSLGITNPLMMAWWVVGAHLLDEIGILPNDSTVTMVIYLISGGLGLVSESSLVAYVVNKLKRSFSPKLVQRITFVFGIILLCLAVYFIFKGGRILLHR